MTESDKVKITQKEFDELYQIEQPNIIPQPTPSEPTGFEKPKEEYTDKNMHMSEAETELDNILEKEWNESQEESND